MMTSMRQLSSAVALSVLIVAAPSVRAGEVPRYEPAPDWVVPARLPSSTGQESPALVLLDQQIRLRDGTRTTYVDQAVRIASAEVLGSAGTLVLDWHPSKGDLFIHRVEIIRDGQAINALTSPAAFKVLQREQQLEQQYVTGILSATMQVDGLRLGDILRLTYSTSYRDPALKGQVEALGVLPALPARMGAGTMRISWPAKDKVVWRVTARDVKPEIVTSDGMQTIVFPLPVPKRVEMPSDAPARFRMPPLLEASSFASWEDVSKTAWSAYQTDGLIAPGSPLANEVAKIAAASSDQRTRAAMALRLVQDEVRYLFSGLDHGNYIPQPPAETWTTRRGDCKAKTLLLLALLRALNVPAEPVLAHATLGDMLPQRLPSFAAFNHVLVRSTIGGQTLWLDGTQMGTRNADLEQAPNFHHVLPLAARGATLSPVVMTPPERPAIELSVSLDQRLGLDLPASFDVTYTFRGSVVESLRSVQRQGNSEQQQQVVDKLMGEAVEDPTVLTREIAFDDASGSATVRATGMADASWPKDGERREYEFRGHLSQLKFDPDRARPDWQAVPVAVRLSPAGRIQRTVLLPEGGNGFSVEGTAAIDEVIAGNAVRLSVDLKDGRATFSEQVFPQKAEILTSDLPAVRARVTAVKRSLPTVRAPANYPPLWARLDSVRSSPAMASLKAAFQSAITDAANDDLRAAAYRDRAYFLADIYDWKGAIADADRLIALRPDVEHLLWRADMWETLGDTKRERADIEAALALDPASSGAFSRLAVNKVVRGETQAGLALADEKISEGGDDKNDFISVKADLLGRIGKAEEGIELLDTAIADNPGSPDLLNNRCWLKGTRNIKIESALRDCTKAIELMESPSSALDSRAMVYFRMGRLDDALADLDAAYRLNDGDASILFMRGIVRGLKGDKAASAADLAGARLMSPMIDRQYADFGIIP